MSDDATVTTSAEPDGGTEDSGFTPPATQQDLNRIISERVKRERDKFADYSDLKAKAARLVELEAAQMTEQERAQRALQQAQEDAAKARSEALRFRIAAEFGLSADDADLYLTATDEDTMRRQAQGLAARAAASVAPGTPRPDPTQGARAAATALNGDPLLDGVKAKLGIR